MGDGTGLGLSIVLGIVKTHAGMIDVISVPSKGTRFVIHFPVHLPPEDELVAFETGGRFDDVGPIEKLSDLPIRG